MRNIIKTIRYILYMICLQLKGLKYFLIKYLYGEERASEYVQKIGYLWSKFTINIIGIKIEVIGQNNILNEPCIFVSNHSSILDIPLILYTSNAKIGFIAKKEILKVPVIGFWLKRSGGLSLDRENPRDAIKCLKECINNINKGYSIGLFPEGTRSTDGNVGEFKKGSFKFATKSKAPIIPISIEHASRSFEDTGKFVPSKIKIVYGKPIYTSQLTKDDEKMLPTKVRDIIINSLKN